ncbi:hypothetical protein BBP40_002699 [Aspergillus hancockii]|nr:hypothetical protein BBP40_002699 [Aspergillus hancockii]
MQFRYEGEVYLDHTGAAVYPQSLIKSLADELKHNLYGNPHAESRSSRHCTERIDEVRKRTLEFFHADPEHLDIVFVQNATCATFVGPRRGVGNHVESHTSIIGARELADAGSHCFTTEKKVDQWLSSGSAKEDVDRVPFQTSKAFRVCLFYYPGQSNMNGHRLPLEWPGRLRRSRQSAHQKILSLWDAAALASTSPLDLSDPDESPDFTVVSFYKIFGFPDLGGLVVRKASASILTQQPYFGGGTVEMVVASDCTWLSRKTEQVPEALEDGTIPFHNIVALGNALTTHRQLYGSQEKVSKHTSCLAARCHTFLSSLRHPNGSKVCEAYRNTASRYGPTIAFNLRTGEGKWIKMSDLSEAANAHHIHLRTGVVCNPGGVAMVLELEPWELLRNYAAGIRTGCKNILVDSKPSGIARVSFGAMSTTGDLEALMEFIKQTYASGSARSPAGALPSSPSILRIEDILVKKVLTQREAPRPVLVNPAIDSERGILRISLHHSLKTCPTLQGDIILPLSDPDQRCKGCFPSNKVSIWDDSRAAKTSVDAFISSEIETFFTAALGVHCTLAKVHDQECLPLPSNIPFKTMPSITAGLDTWMESDQETKEDIFTVTSGKAAPRPRSVMLAEVLRSNLCLGPGTGGDDPNGITCVWARDTQKAIMEGVL